MYSALFPFASDEHPRTAPLKEDGTSYIGSTTLIMMMIITSSAFYTSCGGSGAVRSDMVNAVSRPCHIKSPSVNSWSNIPVISISYTCAH